MEEFIRQLLQLSIGPVLYWMAYKHSIRMKPNGITVAVCCRHKWFRRHITTGNTPAIKFPNVLQTARRTRTSISKTFYHNIYGSRHFLN